MKVSLIGGASLVVPADVRVEVGGFVLLGGKDIERRPESSDGGRILRVRAFGLVGGVRVRVARGGTVIAASAPMMSAAPASSPKEMQPEPVRLKGTVVTSPMVGTVYLSPQPCAPAFVKLGDAVTDGTLCIIEAMKTMNPVPSPAAGRVAEIYVHDGQPVEFGEPLMRIE